MSQTRIEKLTPEQEALIPVYWEKWKAIALSTEPIDRQKASLAVKAAYATIGKKEPEILFFDSPYAVLNAFPSQLLESELNDDFWDSVLNDKIEFALSSVLSSPLDSQLDIELRVQQDRKTDLRQLNEQRRDRLNSQLWDRMYEALIAQVGVELWREWSEGYAEDLENNPVGKADKQLDCKLGLIADFTIQPELLATWYGFTNDFCISVLNCSHDALRWEAFQAVTQSCGWILPLEKIVIVCDRPIKLSFDENYQLHAQAEPAIQFADGYSLYSHHGITLPEKYGTVHPHQWQAQWLLEEENAELRRVLIQEIGYARICQDLQATELDNWQEYTLLKINNDVDVEPICLLKMTCPSTEHIHALRVPPDLKLAREAICWVNWGVDPEEFSVQT